MLGGIINWCVIQTLLPYNLILTKTRNYKVNVVLYPLIHYNDGTVDR